MEKIYVKAQAADIIRRIKMDGSITSQTSIELLDALTDVIDAVEIEFSEEDKPQKKSFPKRILHKLSRNRDYHTEHTSDNAYFLNAEIMESIASRAADLLGNLKEETESKLQSLEEEKHQLVYRINEIKTQNSQLETELRIFRKKYSSHLQEILSLAGKSRYGISGKICELLNELGIKAIWSEEASRPEMFSVLKVEKLSDFREKPCLIYNDEVLLQGIRFEPVQDAEAKEGTEII